MNKLARRMRARKESVQPRGWGCVSSWDCEPGWECIAASGKPGGARICQPRKIKDATPPKGRPGRSRSRLRVKPQPPRTDPETCFQACCKHFEPDGTDCKSADAKITQQGTWGCVTSCLKLPGKKAGDTHPARVRNGCYRPGRPNHPGRAVVACRLPNGGTLGCAPRELPSKALKQVAPQAHADGCRVYDCGCPPGWIQARNPLEPLPVPGQAASPKKVFCCPPTCQICADDDACISFDIPCPGGLDHYPAPAGTHRVGLKPTGYENIPGWLDLVDICCDNPKRAGRPGRSKPGRGRLGRRAAARLRNPGPNGEALMVPPFCESGTCGSKHCGKCDPAYYQVGGQVRTVLEAVEQMNTGIDYAMETANDNLRRMYAPGAEASGDPSIALLSRPGGPDPGNALPTRGWPECTGPAVYADPSSNRQTLPGGRT